MGPLKLNIKLPYEPVILLLSIYAKEMKACAQTTVRMCSAALSIMPEE